MAIESPQKKRQKIKGMGRRLPVSLAVLLILLGGVGLWWFQVRENKHTSNNQVSNSQTTQTSKTIDNNNNAQIQTNDPAENGSYFVIPEWGVRFPTPMEYKGDIKYVLQNDIGLEAGSNVVGSAAYFSSDSMSKWSDYGKGCTPLALTQSSQQLSNSFKVGDQWYKIVNGGALCYTEHDSSYQVDFTQKMVTSLRELEPIPNQ